MIKRYISFDHPYFFRKTLTNRFVRLNIYIYIVYNHHHLKLSLSNKSTLMHPNSFQKHPVTQGLGLKVNLLYPRLGSFKSRVAILLIHIFGRHCRLGAPRMSRILGDSGCLPRRPLKRRCGYADSLSHGNDDIYLPSPTG